MVITRLGEVLKVDAKEFQSWIAEYYKARGWADLNIFVRIGYLAEETGEVARAIRAIELGEIDQMSILYQQQKIKRI